MSPARRAKSSMIPGILLVRRTLTFSVLFSFCHFGSLGILNYYLPEWFQAVDSATPLESGTRTLASVLAQIVGSLTAGILGKLLTLASYILRYQKLKLGHSPEDKLL